jgi:hypothetical protein
LMQTWRLWPWAMASRFWRPHFSYSSGCSAMATCPVQSSSSAVRVGDAVAALPTVVASLSRRALYPTLLPSGRPSARSHRLWKRAGRQRPRPAGAWPGQINASGAAAGSQPLCSDAIDRAGPRGQPVGEDQVTTAAFGAVSLTSSLSLPLAALRQHIVADARRDTLAFTQGEEC